MAILSNQALTLADWRTATNENGEVSDLINLLSQDNEILSDMLWKEANQGTSNKTTVLTGLPAAYWRSYNQGVPRGKSTRVPIVDTCAMLETLSMVDRDLANLNGNSAAWRMSEDKAFIDGMSQQMATTLFYGNQDNVPESFTGLTPRFSTVNTATAASAVNVIDAGGTGSTNASMWVCCWGEDTGYGIYPKGSTAGLAVRDVTTPAPVQDVNGNSYFAYQTHFKWDCGMSIRDWRYFVRIANIDVTTLTGGSAPNLISLLIAAANKMPAAPRRVSAVQGATFPAGMSLAPRSPVIYVNRTIRTALELQVINKSNLLLSLQEWDGMTVLTFRGIPIRTVDALLSTEARVV